MHQLAVSVGELVSMCRGGDINFRFSSKSSGMEGIKGHQAVQQSRGKHYVAEHPVETTIQSHDLVVTINGRVDGLSVHDGRMTVDEIKTLRINVADIPDSVMATYWHQAKLYAYLLARGDDTLTEITVRLCLFHLDEKREYQQEESVSFNDLHQLFIDTMGVYFAAIEQQLAWEKARNQSISQLTFPYAQYRTGQRDMAVSVFRAIQRQEQLVIQAPTGIGKTMAAIFPAIQSIGIESLGKVFYLSARTSTQSLAEKAVSDLQSRGLKLRQVTITAKDKVCFNPGEPCHPDHCEYARGYYDRINDALIDSLAEENHFNRETIAARAKQHKVCPFELSLDLALQCDVIVADYNYVFDPVVHLKRFFDSSRSKYVALIDEAHNLVDRGRDMFSAEVIKEDYLALGRLTKGSAINRAALAINRAILKLRASDKDSFERTGFIVSRQLPDNIVNAMKKFCEAAEEELKKETPGHHAEPLSPMLLEMYFHTLRFVRTAESYADDYVTLLQKGAGRRGKISLKLYCVDPSRQLGDGFDRLSSAICFSATMKPQTYFRRLLGLDSKANWYSLPSPFPNNHLEVVVAPFVDTSYKGREKHSDLLVDLIARVIQSRAGNYLVFFPSYDYLERVHGLFTLAHPDNHTLRQTRAMTESDRETFIASFNNPGRAVCGFAVMGGIFGEGIDLRGDRLVGAIVVGVGLPQLGIERDVISDYFPDNGFEYAYQYPGFTRVLQTAGRVIRDQSDRGIVCLVDKRFRQRRYQELVPGNWRLRMTTNVEEVSQVLSGFWSGCE